MRICPSKPTAHWVGFPVLHVRAAQKGTCYSVRRADLQRDGAAGMALGTLLDLCSSRITLPRAVI